MYAIIKTGGKQYRVEKGGVIQVELLSKEQGHREAGANVEFNEVLLVANGKETFCGAPFVKGYVVKGEVLGTVAGPKINAIKYTPSKNTSRRFGHRQKYSEVKITEIVADRKGEKHGS
jgi:large subunit ribosomal protein L21